MPVNTNPVFIATPDTGTPTLMTFNCAQTDSTGNTVGGNATRMWPIFSAGANGAFVERVKFASVYTASTTSVATTLKVYLSTEPGNGNATTAANTHLLGELLAPAGVCANTVTPTPIYELVLNMPMPPNTYIHVSQATSQGTGTNGSFQAWVHNAGQY